MSISTMAAAALGVLIADVLGLSVGGLIEEISVSEGAVSYQSRVGKISHLLVRTV
jgi:hypothetical protein